MLIIASIGPASISKNILRDIINSGADILRLNFSHNRNEDFRFVVSAARSINKNIHIMQDLCGSKIRVSKKLSKTFKVFKGQKVVFCSEEAYSNEFGNNKDALVPITIKEKLIAEIESKFITMKDNTMVFAVKKIEKNKVFCITKKGGIIRADKGCNIKNINRDDVLLSEKDKKDILWGYENKVDIISQSFVESPIDIKNLKEYIKDFKDFNPKIYAKIESKKGIKNIREIASICDGIIIGRGDLLPETSMYEVPFYEEYILKKLKNYNTKIIFATHLLDSIIRDSSPKLPEIEAIYNIIKTRADGFLLAGETSVGKYPVRAVKILKSLIDKYE
ncbi:pyruvate kinase [Clostridium sp. HCP1S3_B4]|uniref:pyruvate kinase n=1 Tax=unclassified Clostridium TaxID=2614128 RepID=UPI002A779B35|nr:pyruvate kinase [Clostridiales bacterium]MDY2730485.1 pyruvate kinase [Clostridium sp.]